MASAEARIANLSPAELFSERRHVIASSILGLPEKLASLDKQERLLVERLFELEITDENGVSRLVIPELMKPWVESVFSEGRSLDETVESIENQRLVRVQDRHLKSEASFNPLRRKRPQPTTVESLFQRDIQDKTKRDNCPFCTPEKSTPYDSEVGRLSRNDIVSAVNITKFAKEHTLALGKHNPYETTKSQFEDQLGLVLELARQKSHLHPSNKFLRIGINRGYRAGGSQVHDHWQGELRGGSMHFPVAERLNEVAYYYQYHYKTPQDYRGPNFFNDHFRTHQVLGLGAKAGSADVISMLVPLKEHGVMIIDNDIGEEFNLSKDFIDALWYVQQFLMEVEGVREYNIFILPRPNRPDSSEYWSEYRTVAVFMDRGLSNKINCDLGYAELSGTAVISYDPFDFGPRLNDYLRQHSSA